MARKAMVQKWSQEPKFKVRKYNRCKICVVHMVICVNLKCAVFVLENKATKAQSLA